jgi:hypothetical protein
MLRKRGLIGYYKELKEAPVRRKGWQEAWLDQPLDVRPGAEGTAGVLTIAEGAQRVRKRRSRKTPSLE